MLARIAAAAALLIAAGSLWILTRQGPESQVVRTDDTGITEPAAESRTMESESGVPGQEITEDERQDPARTGPDTDQTTRRPERTVTATGIPEEESLGDGEPVEMDSGAEQGPDQAEGPGQAAGTRVVLSGMISGKQSTGFRVREPDQELMASTYYPQPAEYEEEGGIDVFEEYGEDGVPDYSKWAVGGQVSPMYSYRNLSSAGDEAVFASGSQMAGTRNTASYNDRESGIISYSAGLNLNYFPARRLSLQSGVYYSRMGMSVGANYIAFNDNRTFAQEFPPAQLAMSNSSGQIEMGPQQGNKILTDAPTSTGEAWDAATSMDNVVLPEVQEGEILQHFEYIEVPLIVRYRVVDRRLGLNFLGGLSTNFLVGSDVYLQDDGDREFIGTTEELKPVNYSSVLGLGFQYAISRHFFINMEPTFRYYLNSVNTGTNINSHPYSLGFYTGISYLF